MPRVKIEMPDSFSFSTRLSVRITDLNYGDHVGNDQVLSFLHEARVRYLNSLGYTELNMEGVSMIMADAALVYKNEMHYADELLVSIQAVEFSRVGFDLIYQIVKTQDETLIPVVLAKTAMICYDYTLKKIIPLPEAALLKLNA
jgi:acyl-CoA thioester hydrolase